jgi:hypothetical protein
MLIGLSSCGEAPAPQATPPPSPPDGAETEPASTIPSPEIAASVDVDLSVMSLKQVRDRIGNLKGKMVIVDLWALW